MTYFLVGMILVLMIITCMIYTRLIHKYIHVFQNFVMRRGRVMQPVAVMVVNAFFISNLILIITAYNLLIFRVVLVYPIF